MSKFFKKVAKGTNNFFKKVDSGATKFFKKVDDGFDKVGDFAKDAVDKATGVGRQVGNFLEKNSALIAAPVAGLAMASGFGAPVGAAIMAAGATGQAYGSRLKQGSIAARQIANKGIDGLRGQLANGSNNIQNTISNASQRGQNQLTSFV